MQICPVCFDDRPAIHRFIQFPFDLYANNPLWVPPFIDDMRSLLTRRHPFFAHSQAEFFIAESEGQILGRIAVINHRHYNQHHAKNTAMFYYFDCVDDEQVAQGLFNAALAWAKKQGLTSIFGPKGFVRSAGIGLLVEGFEHLPAVGIPYNAPWYDRLVKSAGLEKLTDHLSGYLDRNSATNDRLYRLAEIVKKRGNFWVRSFKSKAELRRLLPEVQRIQHEAFSPSPNYIPSTDAEFALMAGNMLAVADLNIVRFIMKGDEVAGFMAAYPNINRGIQKARGRIWPLGWFHILLDMRRTRLLDLNGIGILPKFQGLGGNAILYAELERSIRASRYQTADFIQVDERNFLSKSDIENFTIAWAKRHRSYITAL